MKKVLSIAAVIIGAGLYSSSASAAPQQVINCPVSKVRVEMTTPLPTGWWRTPYIDNLKSTAIVTIGGKKTLQCKYGPHAAFFTMHLVPQGKKCTTTARGFICKSPIVAPPRTHRTGALSIPQTYLADLDTGRVTQAGADIWFQAKTATDRYITPRNGAKIAVAGTTSVNLRGCKNLNVSTRSIPLRSAPVGTYVCVKTDQGRYSQFRVNQRVGRSPGTLHIGYTTWKK